MNKNAKMHSMHLCIIFLENDEMGEGNIIVKITTKLPHGMPHEKIMNEINNLKGVHMVEEL